LTDAKRLIGRRFEDATVQADMKHWPFEVVSDGGKPKIRISYKGENKIFSPEEVPSNKNKRKISIIINFF